MIILAHKNYFFFQFFFIMQFVSTAVATFVGSDFYAFQLTWIILISSWLIKLNAGVVGQQIIRIKHTQTHSQNVNEKNDCRIKCLQNPFSLTRYVLLANKFSINCNKKTKQIWWNPSPLSTFQNCFFFQTKAIKTKKKSS